MITTMAEPEWDEQTRAMALAYDLAPLCPACGGPAEECQDAEREFDWTTPAPVRCHRKTALLQAQGAINERDNPFPGALLWRLPELRDRSGR
jgi:hypothetical protein